MFPFPNRQFHNRVQPNALARDLDDVFTFLAARPPELQAIIGATAGRNGFPYRPTAHRITRARRKLPTRRAWREVWQFAYTTPVSAVPGNPFSSTNYNAAAVNDILYLLSGQPLVSVFFQPNANYTLALSAAQAAFSKVEGGTTNLRASITLNSSRLMGYWLSWFGFDSTSHNSDAELNALVDGAINEFSANTHYAAWQQGFNGPAAQAPPAGVATTVPYFATALSAGAHTCDPCWRSDYSAGAGTTTLTISSKTNYGGVANVVYEI